MLSNFLFYLLSSAPVPFTFESLSWFPAKKVTTYHIIDHSIFRWMEIGKGITNTCHEAFDRTDTKLGPEAFRFSEAVEARALKANERCYLD